jgi:hypothetical protein
MHKAINTHLECVIVIAFPLQRWLHERASILRYTHIASLQSVIPEEWPWHKKILNNFLLSQNPTHFISIVVLHMIEASRRFMSASSPVPAANFVAVSL